MKSKSVITVPGMSAKEFDELKMNLQDYYGGTVDIYIGGEVDYYSPQKLSILDYIAKYAIHILFYSLSLIIWFLVMGILISVLNFFNVIYTIPRGIMFGIVLNVVWWNTGLKYTKRLIDKIFQNVA